MSLDDVRVELLGSLRCFSDNTELPVGGGRRGAVLALLALGFPRAVAMHDLVDGLWGEEPPDSAVNAIQVYVSGLRRILGREMLVRAGTGYRLDAKVKVDVDQFTAACARGSQQLQQGMAAKAATTLEEALGMWRGPALADVRAAAFADLEVTRLEELRLTALEDRVEADLVLGRHRELVSELEGLVGRHPLRERMRAALMRALFRSGRQPEALETYEAGRRLLADELGLDPSASLRKLHQDILNEDEQEPDLAAMSTLGRAPLPLPFDELVGRGGELETLQTLLAERDVRLVSLIGPGGVGKTRLAIEVAHQLEDTFRDGVVFAALAQATTAADVTATICAAMGVRPGEDAGASLGNALSALRVLLICDNFEHVIDAAPLLRQLLTTASGLRILVTSRRPLGLRGERQFPLSPLQMGSEGSELSPAVRLFVVRAQSLHPRFDPGEAELSDIAAIVGRCDGLPLAVELAAARTRALSVSELRQRLARPLTVLASTAQDLPERQRTMRANIAWSMESLDPPQREFLCRLAVFRGGFTRDAAAAVGDVDEDSALEHLEVLVELSLLNRTSSEDGRLRFDLLETIREYATEVLDETSLVAAQRRHATHYRDWLRSGMASAPGLYSVTDWLALIAESANLREAIRWSLASEDALAADLILRCAPDWQGLGSPSEFHQWLKQLLDLPGLPPARRFDAYRSLAWSVADIDPRLMDEPLAAARELAEAADDDGLRAELARAVATQQLYLGRPDQAAIAVAECQRFASRLPEKILLRLDVLEIQADLEGQSGDQHAAALLIQEALALAQQHHAEIRRSNLIYNYCEHLVRLDQPEKAVGLADEGVALALRSRAPGALPDHLSQRGYARLLLGDGAAALADLRAACGGHLQLGKTLFTLDTVLRVAAAVATDHPDLAAVALGVIDASPEWTPEPGADQTRARYLADLPQRLGSEYEAATERGASMVKGSGTLSAIGALLDLCDARIGILAAQPPARA